MARPDETDLQQLLPLLRQVRAVTGLREDKPGIFYLKRTLAEEARCRATRLDED